MTELEEELEKEFKEVCSIIISWLSDDRIEESGLLLTLFRDYAIEVENLIQSMKGKAK